MRDCEIGSETRHPDRRLLLVRASAHSECAPANDLKLELIADDK